MRPRKSRARHAWQVFRKVTLPFIQPVLYVVGLLGTLWSVNVFDIIWLSTKGGPLATTTTMPVAIYERAFQSFKLGEASAMSVVLAVGLLLFAVVYLRLRSAGRVRTGGALMRGRCSVTSWCSCCWASSARRSSGSCCRRSNRMRR